MWDVEIKIPAWIYAPPKSLTDEERKNIVVAGDRPLLLDVFPTIMDLMGLRDAPGVQPFKAKSQGESLLRGGSPERATESTSVR